MRKIILIIFIFASSNVFSQTIFDYIKTNNYKAIKECSDSINVRDNYEATPLMWAVYKSDLKSVKKLIAMGADPKLKGWIKFDDPKKGASFIYGSCLVIAAGENKLDILKYLLKKQKIPINDKEINLYENLENGWTALHWAAAKGNKKIITYLVKNGANINSLAETNGNATPLLLAILFNQKESAKLLINLGADVNIKDLNGLSAIDYAKMNESEIRNINNEDLINLIKNKSKKQ